MVQVGSVEAVLKLNTSGFQSGIQTATSEIKKLESSMKSLTSSTASITKATSSFDTLASTAAYAASDIEKASTAIRGVSSATTGITKTTSSFESLSSSATSASSAVQKVSTAIKEVSNSSFSIGPVQKSFQQFSIDMDKVKQKTNETTTSVREMANSYDYAVNKLKIFTDTFQTLYSRMSSTGITEQVSKGLLMLDQVLDGTNSKLNATMREFQYFKSGLSGGFSSALTDGMKLLDQTMSSFTTKLKAAEQEAIRARSAFNSMVPTSVTQGLLLLDQALDGTNSKLNASLRQSQLAYQSMSSLNTSFNIISSGASSSSSSLNNLSTSYTRVGNSASSSRSGISSSSSAMSSANSNAKALSGTMTTLRSAVSFTASMFAFQLASSMIEASRAAITNKAEMESYIQVMGMTDTQAQEFNQTLEDTISKFQKVSKYDLGETVASLGVEFGLTNDQMKEAASVVAMIQNEYVRAGRSAEEATLAVKDIMQGEFVRLSRETGVGKNELVDNGWSGDTKDIESLMDALQKIGDARNWDTFASKANSLNDILTITQNRVSTLVADIASALTPAITGIFNEIMAIAEGLGTYLGKIADYFSPIGALFTSTAGRIVTFTTALTAGLIALTAYRTGAGLLEIANMGVVNSIVGIITGTNAETLATYGAKAAIVSKITGYNEEQAAAMGVRNAIGAKVLGLEAETVAEHGLTGALQLNLAESMAEAAQKQASANAIMIHTAALGSEASALLVESSATNTSIASQTAWNAIKSSSNGAILSNTSALYSEIAALSAESTALNASNVSQTMANSGKLANVTATMSSSSAIAAETGTIISETGALATNITAQSSLNAEKAISQATTLSNTGALANETAALLTESGALTAAGAAKAAANMENAGFLQSLLANVIGISAESAALGTNLLPALIESATSQSLLMTAVNAETAANYGNAASWLTLTAAMLTNPVVLALTAAIIALAAALASLYISTSQACSQMEKFNDLVENGDDKIKSARTTMNEYKNTAKELDAKLDTLTPGTAEYNKTLKESQQATLNAEQAEKNYWYTLEGVEKARSAKQKYEEGRTAANIALQGSLANAYMKMGYSAKEASIMASEAMGDAAAGAKQYEQALQSIVNQTNKSKELSYEVSTLVSDSKLSKDKGEQALSDISDFTEMRNAGMEKAMTDESVFGRLEGWLSAKYADIMLGWTDFWTSFEAGDWGAVLGQLGDIIWSVIEALHIDDIFNKLIKEPIMNWWNSTASWLGFCWDAFVGFLTTGWDVITTGLGNVWNGITSWFDNSIKQPILDWWNGTTSWLGSCWTNFTSALTNGWNSIMSGLGGAWNGITEWFDTNIKQPLSQAVSNFLADPLGTLANGVFSIGSFLSTLLGGEEGGDSFTAIWNWLNTSIVQPLMSAFNQFLADPLGFIGGAVLSIGSLLSGILGGGEGGDSITAIWNWLNTSVIQPLMSAFNQFLADPLGFIGGAVLSIGSLLNSLLGGGEEGSSITMIWNWVNTNLITPIGTALLSLPGKLYSWLSGGVSGIISGMQSWITTGISKATSFITNIGTKILQIPGKIYSWLVGAVGNIASSMSSWASTAASKASAMVTAVMNWIKQLPNKVYTEFLNIGSRIADAGKQLVQKAMKIGGDIVNGVLSAMGINSPGFIQNAVVAEFENTITQVDGFDGSASTSGYNVGNDLWSGFSQSITEAQPVLSESGAMASQAIYDGLMPGMANVKQEVTNALPTSITQPEISPELQNALNIQGMDPTVNQDALMQYQTDSTNAQMINTTTATSTQQTFSTLGNTVNSTFTGMGQTMVSTYTTMNTKQNSMLNTMKNNNTNAYKQMQTQTTSSLNNMRNSTANVTAQMTNAWNTMKNNIVSAASQLKSQSTSHFNQLSSTIGSFYRKLQNPSNWGSGDPNAPTRYTNSTRLNTARTNMNRIFKLGGNNNGAGAVNSRYGSSKHGAGIPTSSYGSNNHGAGRDSYTSLPKTMTLKKLLNRLCPSGIDCLGSFSDEELSSKVNVKEFLSQLEGGFGWGSWSGTHFNYIKTTSDEWDMKGPQIMGYIDTGSSFKVKDFEGGSPQISFDSFRKMAEALFTAIPYDFYWNSEKCGSWQAALRSGSVNCSDGADALVALAHTCGFSAYKQHGHWGSYGHFWAVVNGQKMDTTGWQQCRTWTPSQSAGGPTRMPKSEGGKVVINNTVDLNGAVIYGVDDLESVIEESTERAMEKAINVSNIVGV